MSIHYVVRVEMTADTIQKDGPFNDCGAFGSPNWLEFDPKYPHLVYVAADRGAGDENEGNGNMRILDLKTNKKKMWNGSYRR
ncbi:hypothetical protein [Bacteroides thetaiotaomicron]|uniref:hypothetical protein n=1 Tax=Bacteroides thetaiotaomicron TaxID=818 RepID=UPI002165FA16|nr:hypothetical protein [Bacteroides thetaiotaomicron]MCS3044263.1 hypothetical protein [Bacteroides thetaiotaomicron]